MNHTVQSSYCLTADKYIVMRRCFCFRPVLSLLGLLYIPVIVKTVFKIINNFRCFTVYYIHGSGYISIVCKCCYNSTARYRGILGSGKLIAVKCTHIGRTKLHLKIRILGNYLKHTILCRNRERRGLAVRNSKGRLAEYNGIGDNNIDSTFSNHFIFINHLRAYNADSTV